MSQTRILLLCLSKPNQNGLLQGGMEQQILKLIAHFNSHNDSILSLVAHQALCEQVPQQTFSVDSTLSRKNPQLSQSVQEAIDAFKPDIIHCHGLKSVELINALKLSRSIKKLVTIHGFKENYPSVKHVDAVIAVSRDIQTQLQKQAVTSTCIENGIDLFNADSGILRAKLIANYDLNPDWPILICIGRLAKVKAYSNVMKACQTLPVNLIIVGDGPEKKALKEYESEHIKLIGHQHNARRFLYGADALVINSTREGLSLSMIEALQADTPVLSTKVSGAASLLPNEAIIQANSVEELRSEISAKLGNSHKVRRLASMENDAFEYAKTQLTSTRMLNAYQDKYASLTETQAQFLFLGDCNTCGTEQLKALVYADIVGRHFERSIQNCGLTMSTTREALEFFKDYEHPKIEIIFIQYGLVDSWLTIKAAPYVLYYPDSSTRRFLRRWVKKWKKYGRKIGLGKLFGMQNQVPLNEYKENIETIINKTQSSVVLIETAPNHDKSRNQAIKAYNAALAELAQKHSKTSLVKCYDVFERNMQTHYDDPTHFSAEGHQLLAEQILKEMDRTTA